MRATRRCFVPTLILVLVATVAVAAGPFKSGQAETWDYTAAMKKVAVKFKGAKGVFLHIGDSIQYANQSTRWARNGAPDAPPDVKAFLKWAHNGERNDLDGFNLASVDRPGGRSETAASGMTANQAVNEGKEGLTLQDIIKKYNPQMAVYMLGTNDLRQPRPLADYIKDVEMALEMLLANGTIPILSTLPPFPKQPQACEEYNKALRELAKKKQIPLLDLNAEMKARNPQNMEAFLAGDKVHLSFPKCDGPVTDQNLMIDGCLLKCYMHVFKGMEVKQKVLD